MADEEQEVFKFAVTAGLKPGDVVRARTPGGIRVEVTIPPGALPGDVVQFVLPSSAGGSGHGGGGGQTTVEEKVDGPMLMATIKTKEKINVRDVTQTGVSNAAEKITYQIMVPQNTTAGQTLVAELPDGQRVVVTVPNSAKPGRELYFRVPAGGPDHQIIDVYMKGFMKKKSPKGIKGFHAWQMRWFELTKIKLAYWEVSMEGAVEEKGGLPLKDLVGVRKHVNDGERLDLLLNNKRLFQLCAPSTAERDEWATKLQEAMVEALGGEKPSMSEMAQDLPGSKAAAANDADESTVEEGDHDDGDKGEGLESGMDMCRTVSKMPKKEHETDTVKKVEGDGGDDDLKLEVAESAPVQTAVYMSRVQRAKMANAARAGGK